MRLRFFLTILTVLTIASVSVIVLHAAFLKRERLALLDQQVRATATALFNSELSDLRNFSISHVDDIISEELGETRIGKFFIIRNSKGDIIFESSSAKFLPRKDIPRDNTWITIDNEENYIRVLNLRLPRIPDRSLQVGVVWSSEIVNPRYFTRSTLILFFAVLGVGSIASLFLTSFLLKPIARLSDHISDASESLKTEQFLSQIPLDIGGKKLIDITLQREKDEYQKLVVGFNSLVDKVNKYSKNSKLWAYQMAHELKTPLTLINLEAEALQKIEKTSQNHHKIDSIQNELQKISETIGSFLSWAELENSNGSKHLFANRLIVKVKDVIQRLDPQNKKFNLVIKEDSTILCNPLHLEQLILNLLTNSLKHSPDSGNPIDIVIDTNQLIIKDYGPGISQAVLDRLGEPFNKGSEKEGSGLGLAWVSSICRIYNWQFNVTSNSSGTEIRIDFIQPS